MDQGATTNAGAGSFGATEPADWRLVGGRACAWFDARSHAAGAALAARIADPAGDAGAPEIDVRPTGVRVRIPAEPDRVLMISAAAADLGLYADPAGLQELGWVFATGDWDGVPPFWQTATGYLPEDTSRLVDPLHRNPAFRFTDLPDPRPLRNRLHLDVARLPDAVDSARAAIGQEPSGPWQVGLADADGNEVDLCPGGKLTPEPDTADWATAFSAMAYYPTSSSRQASELVVAIADLADHAGIPLLIDLRPDGVMIDSGKDQWEGAAGGPDAGFVDLARRVQLAAGDLGLSADPTQVGFVQLGIDAADVETLRAFWAAVLGYRYDPRPGVTDIFDPRRLNPVVFFQGLDTSDRARCRQRNRFRLELAIPADRLQTMITTAVSSGGRIIERTDDQDVDAPERPTIADPEGNELELTVS